MDASTLADPAFAAALKFTLDQEGRIFEDVPGDPGGATKWGITQADFDLWRHQHGMGTKSVADASEQEITTVYADHYWVPLQCAKLPAAVALEVFDAGVNVGASRSALWLQAVLGVERDGFIGTTTLAAVTTYVAKHSAQLLAEAHLVRRRAYYRDLAQGHPALSKFLRGWLARCDHVAAVIGG